MRGLWKYPYYFKVFTLAGLTLWINTTSSISAIPFEYQQYRIWLIVHI